MLSHPRVRMGILISTLSLLVHAFAGSASAFNYVVDANGTYRGIRDAGADPSTCRMAPAPRMTQAEIDAKRAYRVLRQATAKTWMDTAGVDAVVYPGLLSDISLNDGGGGRAAFGRRDTPGAANGIPTVVFPAGYNDHGQPINLQLLGRAWDDARLVGIAYAFEHLANAAGSGHVAASTVPALSYKRGSHHRIENQIFGSSLGRPTDGIQGRLFRSAAQMKF
jgi:Asp-tRNA(Asn)/Glu-tRNA(Gln) amidotransferase A subunit family amidase